MSTTPDQINAMLDVELARIERLLCEAAFTQLERLLDAEGRSPVVTQEQRGMIARAAKTSVARQEFGTIIGLIVKSDDEIRSGAIDKLGTICRDLLEVTR